MSENIFRVKKDARYFVASNVPFNDERLSWEARGVMGYLLSKPDDWQTRMGDLVNSGPAGMKVIRRVLAELRAYGYMSRETKRVGGGKFIWITTLYETPELNPASQPYTPNGKTVTVMPSRVDIGSTELPSTRSDDDEQSKKIAALSKLYQANIGAITPLLADDFRELAKDTSIPTEWYARAFKIAVDNNRRAWSYVRACLQNMKLHGVDWKPVPAKGKSAPNKQSPQDARVEMVKWLEKEGVTVNGNPS